jgi:hypothetical protein
VTEVACWAHARRKFYDATSSHVVRSMAMLGYTRLLYHIESEAKERNLDPDRRLALRQAKSVPILRDIKAYLEPQHPNVLPKSPEGQAISYVLSNWDALLRYSEDGNLEIDNNGAERSLRGIAVGRKNCLPVGLRPGVVLWERQRRANRCHLGQLHRDLQTTSDHPVQLSPRHLPAHQRSPHEPPPRTPPRPLEIRSNRCPKPPRLIPHISTSMPTIPCVRRTVTMILPLFP